MSDVKRLWLGAPMPIGTQATINISNFTINSLASIDRIAWALQLPADTWTDIGFRYGARAGTPVAHLAGIQSLGSTGLPDGTYLGAGNNGKKAFTPPADATWDGTWRKLALDASVTTTEGQWVALVIEPTGTPDGSNNSSFTQGLTNAAYSRHGAPYNLTQTDGAAFAKVAARVPVFAFYSASQCYGFPHESFFTTMTSTSGNRQALKFTLPAGSGETKKIDAFRWIGQTPATGNTFKLGIWNAAGTALMEIEIDADCSANLNTVNTTFEHMFDDAAATLDFGTAYYIGIESTGSGVGLNGITADTATEAAAFSGGSEFLLSTWDGAAWTDVATTRPLCEFRLTDITEPAGGGGGLILPRSMNGGLVRWKKS